MKARIRKYVKNPEIMKLDKVTIDLDDHADAITVYGVIGKDLENRAITIAKAFNSSETEIDPCYLKSLEADNEAMATTIKRLKTLIINSNISREELLDFHD